MDKVQAFALDQWLSEYPEGKTYDEVIELIREENWDEVTVWELIEDEEPAYIIEKIENTHDAARWLISQSS